MNLAIRNSMTGRAKPHETLKRRLRQALLVLLAAVYVLVGLGGEIACAEEALGAVPYSNADVTVDTADVTVDTADVTVDTADVDGKKTPTVVDHCYSCVPLTIPVAASVRAPAALAGVVSSLCSTVVALEARLLDTPPPKAQI
ncbi:hypothetical protein ACVOMS_25195 [Bradyrhizobium guangxiense]